MIDKEELSMHQETNGFKIKPVLPGHALFTNQS